MGMGQRQPEPEADKLLSTRLFFFLCVRETTRVYFCFSIGLSVCLSICLSVGSACLSSNPQRPDPSQFLVPLFSPQVALHFFPVNLSLFVCLTPLHPLSPSFSPFSLPPPPSRDLRVTRPCVGISASFARGRIPLNFFPEAVCSSFPVSLPAYRLPVPPLPFSVYCLFLFFTPSGGINKNKIPLHLVIRWPPPFPSQAIAVNCHQ